MTFIVLYLFCAYEFSYICNMKWLRKLLKGASLTTALFVVQACYGIYVDDINDVYLCFHVKSAENDSPLKNVEIKMRNHASPDQNWSLLGYTGEAGLMETYVFWEEGSDIEFSFKADGDEYMIKDTVLSKVSSSEIHIKLQKAE